MIFADKEHLRELHSIAGQRGPHAKRYCVVPCDDTWVVIDRDTDNTMSSHKTRAEARAEAKRRNMVAL